MPQEAADLLKEYLEATPPRQWERVTCCNSSRSLYCSECCRILIPRDEWPKTLCDRSIRLPFDVHVILDKKERRSSSTGIQLTAIHRSMMMKTQSMPPPLKEEEEEEECSKSDDEPTLCEEEVVDSDAVSEEPPKSTPTVDDDDDDDDDDNNNSGKASVKLFDLDRRPMPTYHNENSKNNNNDNDTYNPNNDGTIFVLFPEKGSVPISSVASKIKTLVVLDMKWSQPKMKLMKSIASLPKVHLDAPPAESHFWRWHSAGKGMLSTIEAVYFAAMETAASPSKQWTLEERTPLVELMWLFALQYAVIHERSQKEQRPVPFSEEGKNINRELRKLQHDDRRRRRKKRAEEEPFYKL